MKAKVENDRMAIVSAPNSEVKERITNEDLVELGFPDFLVDLSLDRKLSENEICRIFGKVRVDAELNFYNALYTLAKLYEYYMGKTMTLSHSGFDIYLNGEEVFRSYLVKKQNLDTIRNMVKELLTANFNNDFEELEKTFTWAYNQEEAKVKYDIKEIFNRALMFKLPQDERTKYSTKTWVIFDLLETEDFSGKKLFIPHKVGWFGEPYYLEPTRLRLKDALKDSFYMIGISQIQDILVFATYKQYAIRLKPSEKQKIFYLLDLLEKI